MIITLGLITRGHKTRLISPLQTLFLEFPKDSSHPLQHWQDANGTKTATNGRGSTNMSTTDGRGFMASLFFRHELGVDELQQFGDAELVHAGAVVVGLDLEGFM
jgi:hypothetical protein